MNANEINDCFLHDKDRLRHDDALEILKSRVQSIGRTETVSLDKVLGHVIAEEIHAPLDVPLTDNSAVDGYAFSSDFFEKTGGWFPVLSRIAAGERQPVVLPGEGAARIFTGAPMPEGADSVAMQEDCETHEQDGTNFVVIPPGLKPGANRRRAGEDVKQGTLLFSPGEVCRPQDVASLASIGLANIKVFSPVRVAIISTGDELITPGEPIQPGEVFNSNGPLLESLLKSLPVTITNHGQIKDDLEIIKTTLSRLADSHDLILTTGGASLGEEDHILTALDMIGTRHMWQLAIKPGRPMTFGQIKQATFIGLPGNPVAAFICFLLYARQVILTLAGAEWREPVRYPLPSAFKIDRKKPDRREFLRGILHENEGRLSVDKFTRDGSGLITGLRAADGLIEIPEEVTAVEVGEMVNFIPFSTFQI